jgi:hypothetical protein
MKRENWTVHNQEMKTEWLVFRFLMTVNGLVTEHDVLNKIELNKTELKWCTEELEQEKDCEKQKHDFGRKIAESNAT